MLQSYIMFIAVLLTILTPLYHAAKTIDEANKEAKNEVSLFFLNFNKRSLTKIPFFFSMLFNQIYSERHFSWKCFLRSALTSVLFFIFLAKVLQADLYSVITLPQNVERIASNEDAIEEAYNSYVRSLEEENDENPVISKNELKSVVKKAPFLSGLSIFIFLLLFNIVPDYISLYETRYMLGLMNLHEKIRDLVVILIFDAMLTFSIYVITSIFMLLAFSYGISWVLGEEVFFVSFLMLGFIALFMAKVSFIATFATSIWLYLFCITVSCVLLWKKASDKIITLQKILDFENRPFQSLHAILCFLIITTVVISHSINLILQ